MARCPRDARTLSAGELPDCPHCHGVWLPAGLVRRLVGHTPLPRVAAGPLRCPDDGAPLAAVLREGVEIDVCTGCGGAWLDQGELARIHRRIRTREDTRDDDRTGVDETLEVIEGGVDLVLEARARAGAARLAGGDRLSLAGTKSSADAVPPLSLASDPGLLDSVGDGLGGVFDGAGSVAGAVFEFIAGALSGL
jgi:Zn-finger nucleic acid-binding protein